MLLCKYVFVLISVVMKMSLSAVSIFTFIEFVAMRHCVCVLMEKEKKFFEVCTGDGICTNDNHSLLEVWNWSKILEQK